MQHTLFAVTATAVIVMTGAAAPLPRSIPDTSMSGASVAPLQVLLRDWDRAGFLPPSKPGQYRVYGRNGYVTSGPRYNFMVVEIRAAVADSRAGRDHEALAKITTVKNLLTPKPGDPTSAVTACFVGAKFCEMSDWGKRWGAALLPCPKSVKEPYPHAVQPG